VLVLILAALGVSAALVVTSESASHAAADRLAETKARLAALSGLSACLDELSKPRRAPGAAPAGVDGRADSLGSIAAASGPAADLRGAPDGSFTARAVPRGSGPAGAYYVIEAYGKWGASVRGVSAIAEPRPSRPIPAGLFGDAALRLEGSGRADAYDSRLGPYGVAPAEAGLEVLGSNGPVVLAASGARGRERGPVFAGVIYAPAADIRLEMGVGATGAGPASEAALEVAGNVVAGPGAAVMTAGAVRIEGTAASRESPAAPAPVRVDPSGGPFAPLALAAGTEVLAGGAVAYAGVSIAAGATLRVSGEVELRCLGDFRVEEGGAVAIDPGASLHVLASGGLWIGAAGLANPNRPAAARFDLALDSSASPGSALDLRLGAIAGALVGRSVAVRGGPVAIHFDRALREEAGPGPATYRARSTVEIASPPPR
jgi:hypothetical protein